MCHTLQLVLQAFLFAWKGKHPPSNALPIRALVLKCSIFHDLPSAFSVLAISTALSVKLAERCGPSVLGGQLAPSLDGACASSTNLN